MSIAIRNADQLDVIASRIELDPPSQRLEAASRGSAFGIAEAMP
jgi:hypothetical protein